MDIPIKSSSAYEPTLLLSQADDRRQAERYAAVADHTSRWLPMDWNDLYKDETFRLREPNDEVIVFTHHLVERIRPPAPILDVGFGAGRHAVFLARRGYEVHGVDISERGKKYADRWLADEGLTADLRIADMKSLPYPDATFAAVLSTRVLTHGTGPEIRQALAETARVTSPGGLFGGTFISTESSMLGKGERVDDQTWICDDPSESGVTHHFMTEQNVLDSVAPYFKPLRLPAVKHVRHRGEIDTGRPYVSAHWIYIGLRRDA
jgi:ubiquinone/menaquinone biosynthesis C-methylase UbiE